MWGALERFGWVSGDCIVGSNLRVFCVSRMLESPAEARFGTSQRSGRTVRVSNMLHAVCAAYFRHERSALTRAMPESELRPTISILVRSFGQQVACVVAYLPRFCTGAALSPRSPWTKRSITSRMCKGYEEGLSTCLTKRNNLTQLRFPHANRKGYLKPVLSGIGLCFDYPQPRRGVSGPPPHVSVNCL